MEDSPTLRGELKVQVHYYEDGNVQLNTSKEYDAAIQPSSCKDPVKFATEIVGQISKLEAEFQIALNDNHNQLSSNTFKSLRRALPLSKTKIEWQSIVSCKNLLLIFQNHMEIVLESTNLTAFAFCGQCRQSWR